MRFDSKKNTVTTSFKGFSGFFIWIRELMIYRSSSKTRQIGVCPELVKYNILSFETVFIKGDQSKLNINKFLDSYLKFQELKVSRILNLTYFFSLYNFKIYLINSFFFGIIIEVLKRNLSLKLAFRLIVNRPFHPFSRKVLIHNDLRTFKTGNLLIHNSNYLFIDFESVKWEKHLFYDLILLSYDEYSDSINSDILKLYIKNLRGLVKNLKNANIKQAIYTSMVKLGIRYYRLNRSELILNNILLGKYGYLSEFNDSQD